LKFEQQPDGDQLRIVEVVHIGILLQRCSIDLPNRASHSFAPPSRLGHRSEAHAISDERSVVRRDQYHLMTGASQGLALFVIDTDVKSLMDGSQMDNFGQRDLDFRSAQESIHTASKCHCHLGGARCVIIVETRK
jgi:hypothetical protein